VDINSGRVSFVNIGNLPARNLRVAWKTIKIDGDKISNFEPSNKDEGFRDKELLEPDQSVDVVYKSTFGKHDQPVFLLLVWRYGGLGITGYREKDAMFLWNVDSSPNPQAAWAIPGKIGEGHINAIMKEMESLRQSINGDLPITSQQETKDMNKYTITDLFIKNFSFPYIGAIIGLALIIRCVMSAFKACGIRQGEANMRDEVTDEKFICSSWPWRKAFWRTFAGFGSHRTIDDYWLTVLIGIAELYVYPILMVASEWKFIAFWLGFKTASGWGTWQKTRTAYSRFLFGNLLVLATSLLLTILFRLKVQI
jgi:hypothetical protein